jgi:hypothetical protein
MTRSELLLETGDFYWDFSFYFFIETLHGNWVWQDPENGGNNSLTSFEGSLQDFESTYWEGFKCTPKGKYTIGDKVHSLALCIV